jgi:hypothetical protein
MIDKCFGIKKTTFYDWYNDDDIQNTPIINENNNKLINYSHKIIFSESKKCFWCYRK